MAEELLAPITEQVVMGRAGPRFVCGDFNQKPGSLRAMQLWKECGWIEFQDYMQAVHQVPIAPTCKQSSTPDQLWMSPELAACLVNSAIWDVYPDHSVVVAGIRLPKVSVTEFHWSLAGRIPWEEISEDLWTTVPDGPHVSASYESVGDQDLRTQTSFPGFDPSCSPTAAFERWSKAFECHASNCVSTAPARIDRSYHGRGQRLKPTPRRPQAPVFKPSREGEHMPANSFLNRSVSLWFRQLRRLQSYQHAIKSPRAPETFMSRASLWHSLIAAHGFTDGFCNWWAKRPVKTQPAPAVLPDHPPDAFTADAIFSDFHQNYRRFEHWQLRRRQDSVRAKVMSSSRGLFLATRKPPKASLDCVEEVVVQTVSVVDAHQGLVSVPSPFPENGIHTWTLQNEPALVQPHGPHYKLDSDLLLVDGQKLACHITIHEASAIHQRLIDLWSPRWSKHLDVPDQAWNRIVDFAEEHLPRKNICLPRLTVDVWKRAVRSFKQSAATGPCGWSRQDLLQMSDRQVQGLIDFFERIESTAKWPAQFTVGLIHLLQKKDDIHDVNGFRPITVMSLLYRVYTGIRAGQLLSQIASLAADWQCGFMQGKQAADLWIFIGVCVELSLQQQTPVHGYVADLVKAYNTLPRHPVFRLLACIGVPDWFLTCWSAHLKEFSRMFVVRGACSHPVSFQRVVL